MVQAWADPIGAARQTNAAESAAHHYYIEFRVAVDGVYGHSYVAYGRLNAHGQPATATYADIHPTGDIPSMVLGHFIPMNAATSREKDTLGFKIADRFRGPLTATEYDRVKSIIARIRAARHAWSILGYNCNDFVADVARGDRHADTAHAITPLRLHSGAAGDERAYLATCAGVGPSSLTSRPSVRSLSYSLPDDLRGLAGSPGARVAVINRIFSTGARQKVSKRSAVGS